MTTYKGIQGFGVQTLATDPDSAGWIGSIFYNSTSGTFKTVKPGGMAAGTWASAASLNTARSSAAAAGIYTAGLVFGGEPPTTGKTEAYNGTSWSEQNDLSTTGYNMLGCGLQNGALRHGGYNGSGLDVTEEYDGTSWTTGNITPVDINSHTGSFGTQTAALAVSGNQPPGTVVGVFAYNGTDWTVSASVNTAKEAAGGFGTTTSGLVTGLSGQGTESWDGTSWTEVAEKNTDRALYGGASGTSNTDGLVYGGTPPTTGKTEFWNGTSWTELADMATSRTTAGVGNSSVNALAASGLIPPVTANTEEWTAPDVVINTLTTS
jgi:hypothetical protein